MEVAYLRIAGSQPKRPISRSYGIHNTRDSGAWLTKIHGKGRDMLPTKLSDSDYGARKAQQKSLPAAPTGEAVLVLPTEDLEDAPSEYPAVSAPRACPQPKPARYTSLFSAPKEEKGSVFSEPWDEQAMLFQPRVDPMEALLSTRSYIHNNPSTPIPCTHNSGLLNIFEDYREVKNDKEQLELALEDALREHEESEHRWGVRSGQLHAEIRRLESMVAPNESCVSG
jgi:hypothetical protein